MAKIHNGFINNKLKNTLKDSGLNNFDLATTKLYRGVKPMWEQLGFENDEFDIIAVGRPLLSDAEWVNKTHDGRENEIVDHFQEANKIYP